MAALSVNGTTHQVDVDPNTPLLWVLRETIGLTGTKYGCGIAQCGACTVHVDGIAMRSCSVPLSAVDGRKITTIEGLAQNGVLHKVQQAWLENDVPQRQMLLMLASMSASVCLGLSLSSAATAMIIPHWQ